MQLEGPFVDLRLALMGAVVLNICRILILITAVYMSIFSLSTQDRLIRMEEPRMRSGDLCNVVHEDVFYVDSLTVMRCSHQVTG